MRRGVAATADVASSAWLLYEHQRLGCVPLSVKVAQVEATSVSIFKYRKQVSTASQQLVELQGTKERGHLTEYGLDNLNAQIKEVTAARDWAQASLEATETKWNLLRDQAIASFTPRLLESVSTYQTAFEKATGHPTDAKQHLDWLEEACVPFATTAEPLRQKLPDAAAGDPGSIDTLVALLATGEDFALPALRIVADSVRTCGGPGTEVKMGPLKGYPRCLNKTEEDYGGDYTRLVDLVRTTIIFESLLGLVKGLRWLLDPPESDSNQVLFKPRRAKDRLSLAWDAEMSGGYRDVVVVGEVSWKDGKESRGFLVEVQLHLRPLFVLKHELHALYKAVRVLGAAEDEVAVHNGRLSERAVDRARKGIVRRLRCNYSPIDDGKAVAGLLQLSPCPLLELRLVGPRVEDSTAPNDLSGWRLDALLLGLREVGPPTRRPGLRLQCTRLQHLVLGRRDLVGPIPEELSRCVALQTLGLNGNRLEGPIPPSLGLCSRLEWVYLQDNHLVGPVPATLCNCKQLRALQVQNNRLDGELPSGISLLERLKEIRLEGTSIGIPVDHRAALEKQIRQNNGGDEDALQGRIGWPEASIERGEAVGNDSISLTAMKSMAR